MNKVKKIYNTIIAPIYYLFVGFCTILLFGLIGLADKITTKFFKD